MEMPPIRMTLKWRVAPKEGASVTSALQWLMARTRERPGCTRCSLSTDTGPRVEIRYTADWESECDLQREIRSSTFLQLAELMEHATETPIIEFALPSGIHGLEYAEKIRQKNDA